MELYCNSVFKACVFLVAFHISASSSSCQTTELVGNGTFESFSSLPDDISQTSKLTGNWFGVSLTTPDFYNKGSIQGPCNLSTAITNQLTSTNFLTITQPITPKIEPYGMGYCGFGTSEIIGTELLSPVVANNMVKFSFDYSFRDNFHPISISYRFGLDNELDGSNTDFLTLSLGELTIARSGNTEFLSCNWFHFESDWIKINEGNWKVLTLGGANNISGAIDAIGYLYIDNVSLLVSQTCCQETQFYQNTTSLPETTKVIQQIHLGESVIPNKPSGPVIISVGETAVMQAKEIILDKGVIRESGATLILEPIPCSPTNNQSTGNTIIPIILPNLLVKDNLNTLNFEFQNVEYFKLKIYNRYGCKIYENNWQKVETNIFGTWTGTCEGACSASPGDACSDGIYYYILDVKNCSSSAQYENYFAVLSSSNARITENSTLSEQSTFSLDGYKNTNEDSLFEREEIKVYPIPTDGQIFVCVPESFLRTILNFEILDSRGVILFGKTAISTSKTQVSLELLPGLYLMRISSDNKQYLKTIIIL